jgi:hypothetical protein
VRPAPGGLHAEHKAGVHTHALRVHPLILICRPPVYAECGGAAGATVTALFYADHDARNLRGLRSGAQAPGSSAAEWHGRGWQLLGHSRE